LVIGLGYSSSLIDVGDMAHCGSWAIWLLCYWLFDGYWITGIVGYLDRVNLGFSGLGKVNG